MLGVAKDCYSSGLHIIPIWKGKKNPKVKSFNFETRLSEVEIDKNFDDNTDIGIVCGKISGSVEAIDFDNHFGDSDGILGEFTSVYGVQDVFNKCVVERTARGGYHVIYKCKKIGNSKKLAERICSDINLFPNGYELEDGKKLALIETRGEGGYIVAAPSTGYELIQGDFNNIPEITTTERNILITAALSLNEYHTDIITPPEDKTSSGAIKTSSEGKKAGEIYNDAPESEAQALDILIGAGWTQAANRKHLVRPNKELKDGISATFGHVARGVLNVFSSNAQPFEQSRGYTPFQIRALIKHNGDFSACAKELWSLGYRDKTKLDTAAKKKVYSEVKKNLKSGRLMSPSEINTIAEKIDSPVDKVAAYALKCQEQLKDLEDYEDWTTIKKAEYFLQNNYKFRVDIIRRIAEMRVKGGQWENLNEHSIHREIQHREPKLKFSLDGLKSLLKSDFVERYNPFIEHFENVEEWDKIDHIKNLCSYFGVDDPEFFEAMVKKAMVRNIKCALEPDYYNRIVLVFSSEHEEIGKSRFFMWLNPFGARYYSDEILRDNKDSRLALAENFIYNLEELDGLSKYGSAKLKATISTRGVTDRLPYAANKEYFPRCCTFWGSTNEREFLMNDKNTRWLPFQINSINWKGYIKDIDVQKLWSQAWALYCSDFDSELNQDEKNRRNDRNDAYRVEDIEESIIKKHFSVDHTRFMTNAEILAEIQIKANGLKISWTTVSLGKSLSRLGFQKKRAGNQRGWGIIQKDFMREEPVIDNIINEIQTELKL